MSKNLDKEFWLKYFRVYDILNKLIPYKETLVNIASRVKGNNLEVLDVGCGTGNLDKILINNKDIKKIVGIDFSEEALMLARQKVDKKIARYYLADINKDFLFEDESFDFVVMNNVLYTIEKSNRKSLVSEIYRVLRPGGSFILSNINDNFKPITIYSDHISKSVKNKGFFRTLIDIIIFIKPTILVFYYNYLIKKENNKGAYDFMELNEQGHLLKEAGFVDIEDNIKTYSGNAYLTLGKK